MRADSGFYNHHVVDACVRADARFSVTVRADAKVRAAIAGIDEDAWTPIPYWSSHTDPDTGQVVESHADVAETTYTAFAGTARPVTARLLVRRVRRLRPRTGQLELATDIWRHHAILTDRIEPLPMAEAEHRAHAIIEQVICDLKSSAMAHLPSGSFNAGAAWLALAALAHNLTRALATLAGFGLGAATTATIRRTLIAIPARLVRSARRWHLRMPEHWPWQRPYDWAVRRILAIPRCGPDNPTAAPAHHPRKPRKRRQTGDYPTPAITKTHFQDHQITQISTRNLVGGSRLRETDVHARDALASRACAPL